MPIYVILAGCLQAPHRRARVTKRAQFCSSMARLAHTGTQGTGSGSGRAAAGHTAGTASAIAEISTPRSRMWHRHAFCLLIWENMRAAAFLGWGRCVCVVFCRHAALFCAQSWTDISQLQATSKLMRLDCARC